MGRFSFSLAPENVVNVAVQEGLIGEVGPVIAELTTGRKAMVLTHPVVADLFMNNLKASLESAGFAVQAMSLPEGESSKEWDNLTDIFAELRQGGFDRSDVIVSLGGGVAGDIATVVAGLYMRGLSLVHMPTTLLSQVDSCLGGKGAVNFGPGKNMLGLFYQPKLIVVDPDLLKTLPDEQLASGYAEAVKCALLSERVRLALGAWRLEGEPPAASFQPPEGATDGRLALGAWRLGETVRDQEPGTSHGSAPSSGDRVPGCGVSVGDFQPPRVMASPLHSNKNLLQQLRAGSQEPLIQACLTYKASVVKSDPLDTGVRQQLNLGHTFAHALEAVGGYSEYNHGQAVGLGLLAALRLSELRYGINRSIEDEVRRLLDELGLPTCTTYGYDDLQPYFKADKKGAAGKPRFVGLKALDEYAMIEDAREDELREALQAVFCESRQD
jgi:3-dehydroquinate synthetase